MTAALTAMVKHVSGLFPVGSRWNHVRTGGPYTVTGYAVLNLPTVKVADHGDGTETHQTHNYDGVVCVLYTRDGFTFARPPASFAARFRQVESAVHPRPDLGKLDIEAARRRIRQRIEVDGAVDALGYGLRALDELEHLRREFERRLRPARWTVAFHPPNGMSCVLDDYPIPNEGDLVTFPGHELVYVVASVSRVLPDIGGGAPSEPWRFHVYLRPAAERAAIAAGVHFVMNGPGAEIIPPGETFESAVAKVDAALAEVNTKPGPWTETSWGWERYWPGTGPPGREHQAGVVRRGWPQWSAYERGHVLATGEVQDDPDGSKRRTLVDHALGLAPNPAPEVTVTVHLLAHGRALCRFHSGPPSEWPPEHRWLAIDDHENRYDVNCGPCEARITEIHRAMDPFMPKPAGLGAATPDAAEYPECPLCKTGRYSTDRARVEREDDELVKLPCARCGKLTEWRTIGTPPSKEATRG